MVAFLKNVSFFWKENAILCTLRRSNVIILFYCVYYVIVQHAAFFISLSLHDNGKTHDGVWNTCVYYPTKERARKIRIIRA